jgi:hypothetical protein
MGKVNWIRVGGGGYGERTENRAGLKGKPRSYNGYGNCGG